MLVAVGGLAVGTAVARGPWAGGGFGPWSHARGGGHGGALPAALVGLHDIPAAERFAHFQGGQLNLTDRDGQPLVLSFTPATVTTASASSLTVAANDGAARTFALDAQTAIRGPRARTEDGASGSSLAAGDKVVVVTINQSGTAAAVWAGPFEGWGPHRAFGR
jgi:hypothetical protein